MNKDVIVLSMAAAGLLLSTIIANQPDPAPKSTMPTQGTACPYLKASIDAGGAPQSTIDNYQTFC